MLVLPEIPSPNGTLRLACPAVEVASVVEWISQAVEWENAEEARRAPRIRAAFADEWPQIFANNPIFGFWFAATLDWTRPWASEDLSRVLPLQLEPLASAKFSAFLAPAGTRGAVLFSEAYWRFKVLPKWSTFWRLIRRSCVGSDDFAPPEKSVVKKLCRPYANNLRQWMDRATPSLVLRDSSLPGHDGSTAVQAHSHGGSDHVTGAAAWTLAWSQAIRSILLVHRFADLVQEEKLSGLKRLAYGASHEINNPLANIATRAQTLMAGETDPERRQRLAIIYGQAMRAHDMISDMMLFANPPSATLETTDLASLGRAVLQSLRPSMRAAGIRARVVVYPDVEPTEVDRQQMTTVLRNVIQNSMDAMRGPGEIRVRIFRASEDCLGLSIVDTGPGFTDSTAESAFDPFHSDREAGRGLGFGLAKAWRYLGQIGGHIFVDSKYRKGGKVEIRIPFRSRDARRIDRPIAA